ncbi:MAG: DUF4922 domain-containing protein [Ignavibacteria bacterium]|nr:DUF4922 domain-containing protein [Ignavibacteria bacterium]
MLNKKLLTPQELKFYYTKLDETNFSDSVYATFLHQKENWGMLSDGWKGFQSSEYKTFDFGWFSIKAQFNPTRFVSSSAKVDDKSIKERKCFLCIQNLPEEQKGILFEDRLIVLCNPAPIFNEHFTISDINHTKQEIKPNLATMLNLTKALNGEYTVFYNGPRCGASAPDHFHFQACPSNELLTEIDIKEKPEKFSCVKSNSSFSIFTSQGYLRNLIWIRGKQIEVVCDIFHLIYGFMNQIMNANDEPMMNLFSFMNNDDFNLVIFPREKHRPDVYFLEGNERMLISPGLVDMAGILITPLQKDFDSISTELIKSIFAEVTLNQLKFSELISKINESLIT